MPSDKFVQDADVALMQIHHEEAFKGITGGSSPTRVEYLRFDPQATEDNVDDLYDEVRGPGDDDGAGDPDFIGGIFLNACIEKKPRKEVLNRLGLVDVGADDRPDVIIFLLTKQLTEKNINLTNRDHFKVDGTEYSTVENDDLEGWDNREFERAVMLKQWN